MPQPFNNYQCNDFNCTFTWIKNSKILDTCLARTLKAASWIDDIEMRFVIVWKIVQWNFYVINKQFFTSTVESIHYCQEHVYCFSSAGVMIEHCLGFVDLYFLHKSFLFITLLKNYTQKFPVFGYWVFDWLFQSFW